MGCFRRLPLFDIIQTAKDFGVDETWAIARRFEYLKKAIAELEADAAEAIRLFSGHGELGRYLLFFKIPSQVEILNDIDGHFDKVKVHK